MYRRMKQLYTNKKIVYRGINPTEENDLLVKIHAQASPGDCPKSPFRSEAYGVLMVTKGTLKVKINFNEYIFKQRDILCVVPDSIYEIPDEPNASIIYTHFSKEYLSRKGIFLNIIESYKIFKENETLSFSLSKSEYEHMHADIMALHHRLSIPKTTRYIDDIIHNSFLSIVYDIFLLNEKQKKVPVIAIDSKMELTSRFLALVAERFNKEKRVRYYADCLRITPRHLSQVVKQVTGKSASQHIDYFVVREAKLLLTGHTLNIAEIAEKLRFSNPSFFGKYFKKHAGITPMSFKLENNIMPDL